MNLRKWQKDCIEKSLSEYSKGKQHFLCLATPGAGKTAMASSLAQKLMDSDKIDMVMCFSPSVVVAEDFKIELERQTGKPMNGRLGSMGLSVTYQSMLSLEANFWSLLKQYRVLVIFDEIHHCAGSGSPEDPVHSNSWGAKVINNIQGHATYTIALTGTPWRSDQLPIVLANYDRESRLVKCDYSYGLSQAIQDNVCRTPTFTIIDNDSVRYKHENDEINFNSFEELLKNSNCSYQNLLESAELIEYCLKLATKKLDQIRQNKGDAGGLIVSTSVQHAHKIHEILMAKFGENAEIVTHKDTNAPFKINEFKLSCRKWIISVGMISEGTNIPRLQVCCHLTRVKTELYFRQVLGRVLRSTGHQSEKGYMIMPAEPKLIEYANRVKSDIPKVTAVNKITYIEDFKSNSTEESKKTYRNKKLKYSPTDITLNLKNSLSVIENENNLETRKDSLISTQYMDKIKIAGNFTLRNIRI